MISTDIQSQSSKKAAESAEIPEDDIIEEIIEPIMTTPSPSLTNMPVRATRPSYVYKEEEKKWDPFYQSSKFINYDYYHEELIIEPPACFDGTAGQYEASFDDDNKVFVLKIAPNQALGDPHAISSYYETEYGIKTAGDSARDQAFKESARVITDKWYTFRHRLEWPGKPASSTTGRWWIDFADITVSGRIYPLLIVNICSIKPVEIKVEKTTSSLNRKKHLTPIRMTTGTTSEKDSAIMTLQKLFPTLNEEEREKTAAIFGLTSDQVRSSMDVEERPNKRDRA